MADPFGLGTGIAGVIGVAIQATQIIVQFGLDWKDAPVDAKSFMAELGTLQTILLGIQTKIILNPDFADAFQSRSSLLLSQLGNNAPDTTDTMLMLATCQSELVDLLKELKKRDDGHRVGWERLKGAFLAKHTRNAVENLRWRLQTLSEMLSVDVAALGATTYKEVTEARKEQMEWHQSEMDQRVLRWLTKYDYDAQHSDFFSQRQEGTGQWLLDSKEFQEWLTQSGLTLFCPGIPGAGKTILASIVIDHLYNRYQGGDTGIAYIYCNFRRGQEQKPEHPLSSILKQFLRAASVPETLKQLYEHHNRKLTRPSVSEVAEVLRSVAANYSRTFIIIDALDECQASDGSRKKLLSELFTLRRKTRTNLFVASRFIPEVGRGFEGSLSVRIRAGGEDVRRYLEGHMSKLLSFVSRNADLQEEIIAEISQAVEGMFLLAKLHLDSLIGKRSPKSMRAALKRLQRESGLSDDSTMALDSAYKEAMERINGQIGDQTALAKQVLSYARRPLTTSELRNALAVEAQTPALDEENLPEVEDMVSVCAGLVAVDRKVTLSAWSTTRHRNFRADLDFLVSRCACRYRKDMCYLPIV